MAPDSPSPGPHEADTDTTPFHSPRSTFRPLPDRDDEALPLSNSFATLADQAAPSSDRMEVDGALTRQTGWKRAATSNAPESNSVGTLALSLVSPTQRDFANEHCADTEEALLTAMAEGTIPSFTRRFSQQQCLVLLHDLQLPGRKKESKTVLVSRLRDHYERLFPEFAISHDLQVVAAEDSQAATPATDDVTSQAPGTQLTITAPKRRRCTPRRTTFSSEPIPPPEAVEEKDQLPAASRARIRALAPRPSQADLFYLRDVELRVLLSALSLPRINRGGKEPMVRALLAWLQHHPGQPLPLPDDLQRFTAGAPSHPQSTPTRASHPDERRSSPQFPSPPTRPKPSQPPLSQKSYAAAAAQGPSPLPPSSIDTASLGDILQRAQQVLQQVLDNHLQPSSNAPNPPPATLATLARSTVKELQAARAGLAAAAALSSHAATIAPHSSHPPSGSSSRQHHRRPTRAMVADRCLVLDPPNDQLRRLPSDFSRMGRAIDQALTNQLSLTSASTPIVEMLRRTSKGGYCVQLFPSCSDQARALSSLTLPDGTIWRCTPLSQSSDIFPSGDKNPRPATIRRDSFIVTGVPDSIADPELLKAFADSNAQRFRLSPGMLMARLKSAERLQRRLSRGPDAGTWVPSHSVRFSGDTSLVTDVLNSGHVVLDFRALEVRPYSFPSRHCFHCGSPGHVAKHCRSRCHRCDSRHPTQPCPLGTHGLPKPARSTDLPPGFSAADGMGTRPTGRLN